MEWVCAKASEILWNLRRMKLSSPSGRVTRLFICSFVWVLVTDGERLLLSLLSAGERARGDGGVSGGPPPPAGALRFSDVLQNFSGS